MADGSFSYVGNAVVVAVGIAEIPNAVAVAVHGVRGKNRVSGFNGIGNAVVVAVVVQGVNRAVIIGVAGRHKAERIPFLQIGNAVVIAVGIVGIHAIGVFVAIGHAVVVQIAVGTVVVVGVDIVFDTVGIVVAGAFLQIAFTVGVAVVVEKIRHAVGVGIHRRGGHIGVSGFVAVGNTVVVAVVIEVIRGAVGIGVRRVGKRIVVPGFVPVVNAVVIAVQILKIRGSVIVAVRGGVFQRPFGVVQNRVVVFVFVGQGFKLGLIIVETVAAAGLHQTGFVRENFVPGVYVRQIVEPIGSHHHAGTAGAVAQIGDVHGGVAVLTEKLGSVLLGVDIEMLAAVTGLLGHVVAHIPDGGAALGIAAPHQGVAGGFDAVRPVCRGVPQIVAKIKFALIDGDVLHFPVVVHKIADAHLQILVGEHRNVAAVGAQAFDAAQEVLPHIPAVGGGVDIEAVNRGGQHRNIAVLRIDPGDIVETDVLGDQNEFFRRHGRGKLHVARLVHDADQRGIFVCHQQVIGFIAVDVAHRRIEKELPAHPFPGVGGRDKIRAAVFML